jgi:hypothetical protein
LNISTGLEQFVMAGIMTPDAAALAARKAWEDYMGIPYEASLDSPDANPDDIATHVDGSGSGANVRHLSRLPAPATA